MFDSSFSLIETEDGSATLHSEVMQESYHSMHGAIQESMHVFIQAGLLQIEKKNISIFEVGFGTGLNALLSWNEAKHHALNIHYVCVEAFPLTTEIYSKLNYNLPSGYLPPEAFKKLHESNWNERCTLDPPSFDFMKIQTDFTRFAIPESFDLIYFDAFSPDKQPEMWEELLFEKIYNCMNTNGILVTYCAKGVVRRALQKVGFQVERIPGPPGKREMLRATKN